MRKFAILVYWLLPSLLSMTLSVKNSFGNPATIAAIEKHPAFFSLPAYFTGTWAIRNFAPASADSYTDHGTLEIDRDGTFTVSSGSFAAAGLCGTTSTAVTFLFKALSPDIDPKKLVSISISPTAVKSAPIHVEYIDMKIGLGAPTAINQITLSGTGGCGNVGELRISVLTPL
jgi:hypothetical protein